jgi:hypothetical protein
MITKIPRALIASAIGTVFVVACGSNRAVGHSSLPPYFCGRGGHPKAFASQIVATTTSAEGDVLVWIPSTAMTPDGRPPASPPLTSPEPVHASSASEPPEVVPSRLESSRASSGPPGTVPMRRAVAELCECDEGYIKQANGSCAAVADVCSPEGSSASGLTATVCCPGLDAVSVYRQEGTQCVLDVTARYRLCVRCGNGNCGPGEDSCNCPRDCSATSK